LFSWELGESGRSQWREKGADLALKRVWQALAKDSGNWKFSLLGISKKDRKGDPPPPGRKEEGKDLAFFLDCEILSGPGKD